MLAGLPRAAARRRRRDDRRRHRLDRPHRRDRRVVRREGRALPLERVVRRRPQRLDRGRERRLADLPRRRRAHGGRPTPACCAACSAARGARASTSSRPTTPAASEAGSAVTHMALRIWRNRPQYRFTGRIHEQKTHTMPTYLPERFEATRIRVRHYGYLNQRIASKDKSRRNIELLEQEAQEARTPFTDYNLGSEYLVLGDHAEARKHLDRAWEALREQGLNSVGYAPLLVARVARARREVGDHDAAIAAVDEGLARLPRPHRPRPRSRLERPQPGRPRPRRRARAALPRHGRRARPLRLHRGRRDVPRAHAPGRDPGRAGRPRGERGAATAAACASTPTTSHPCCRSSRP